MTKSSIMMLNEHSVDKQTGVSAHVFTDTDDRIEELKEEHTHIKFRNADLLDMSTTHKEVTFTVRITTKLAKLLGIVARDEAKVIVVNDWTTIFITGDGSIYKAFDTNEEYKAPADAPEPSSGGFTILRYIPQHGVWEYTDRSPDEATMKEYMRILAQHRKG